jgi:hypothetical protein
MHGEMAENFEPKVWWLVLGMNDLSRMHCSEEVTVIGILRVVEEILKNRPNARVVINSLLPMVYSRGGQYALIHDYQDSLGELGNRLRDRTRYDPTKETDAVNDEKEGWRRKRQRQRRLRAREAEKNDNDDAEEETRFETEVRKKEGKREDASDHAVLDAEAHKTRKYNLISGFLPRHHARKLPPLWTAAYAVNKELKAFADKNSNVDFFDATPVFATELSKAGKYELLSTLISARGHPTPAGFAKWEDAMMVRLDSIISAMKQDHPELFPVLYRGNDDSTGVPNVTNHPGFGFEHDAPPEVGMRFPVADDQEEEGDAESKKSDEVETPKSKESDEGSDDGDGDDDGDEDSKEKSDEAPGDGDGEGTGDGANGGTTDGGEDGNGEGGDQDQSPSTESQAKDAEGENSEEVDASEAGADESPPSGVNPQPQESENDATKTESAEQGDQEPDPSKNADGSDAPPPDEGGGAEEGADAAGGGAAETPESSPESDPQQQEEEPPAQPSDGESQPQEDEKPSEPQQ